MSRAAARVVRDEPELLSNDPPCDPALLVETLVGALERFAIAQEGQSAEIRRLRFTIRAGVRQVQPACNAVRGLCGWVKKWGPWILGSAPGVLLAIGAISPNAAEALAAFLAGAPGL
jgi:hypothetical protein